MAFHVTCKDCGIGYWIDATHACGQTQHKPVNTEELKALVTNTTPPKQVTNRVAKVLAWRKAHPDRYRETQRNLMRKRRTR